MLVFGLARQLTRTTILTGQQFGDNWWDKYKEWGLAGHNGVDIPCLDGEPVYASHNGYATRVTEEVVGSSGTRGKGIWITSQERHSNGFFMESVYWHLKDFNIYTGKVVKEGDLIGWADNTGYSTGPHLHFGIRLKDGNGNVINTANGFSGYVDPLPYFMQINQAELENLYLAIFGRLPDAAAQGYVDHELIFVLDELMKSPENIADSHVLAAVKDKFSVKL